MKGRVVPLLLVLAISMALVLNSQGKLVPIGREVFNPVGYDVPNSQRIGNFALAFFVYLIVIAFLDDRNAEYLTGVLVLGALVYNQTQKGENSVLQVLFGSGEDAPPSDGDGGFVPIIPKPGDIRPENSGGLSPSIIKQIQNLI